MKKAFLFGLILIFIIVITLTIMPLSINADTEWKSAAVGNAAPNTQYTVNWTNPNGIGISFVVIWYYLIADPTQSWGPWVYTQDSTQGIATVTGIGTPHITATIVPGLGFMDIIEFRWSETVRTGELACKMVWINNDNHFQFSFINLYADNNWVRIYDMEGNMVYETDMPLKDGNLTVDLPDGMYTVKTFHDQPEPIQEFIIGKPADMGYEGADNTVNHEAAPANNETANSR